MDAGRASLCLATPDVIPSLKRRGMGRHPDALSIYTVPAHPTLSGRALLEVCTVRCLNEQYRTHLVGASFEDVLPHLFESVYTPSNLKHKCAHRRAKGLPFVTNPPASQTEETGLNVSSFSTVYNGHKYRKRCTIVGRPQDPHYTAWSKHQTATRHMLAVTAARTARRGRMSL